jgi:pimeloyl-ACP methyl ester carboxylesterase
LKSAISFHNQRGEVMRLIILTNVLWLTLGVVSARGADGSIPIPADAGDSEPVADAMPGTVPIDPPVPDECITDVSVGDHTFNCDGMKYQVMVDEKCTKFSCGLIFDVHGAAMTGEDMRTNNELHLLAPPQGFLTVHPTSPTRSWAWATDPPKLVDFMDRMIKAFHVDKKRIHMTGFSMGSAMTFWFLCNHREALASVAPVTNPLARIGNPGFPSCLCAGIETTRLRLQKLKRE